MVSLEVPASFPVVTSKGLRHCMADNLSLISLDLQESKCRPIKYRQIPA